MGFNLTVIPPILRASGSGRPPGSLLRRLPLEVLCQIFTFFIRADPDDVKPSWLPFFCSLTINEDGWLYPTMLLTWVCSSWRRIVLGYPFFWNSAFISLPAYLNHPSAQKVLDHYISHSADLTLDFAIAHRGKYYPEPPEDECVRETVAIDTLYDSLTNECSRWGRFASTNDIDNYWENYFRSYLDQAPWNVTDYPKLKFIQWDAGDLPFEALFVSCPRLQVYRGSGLWIFNDYLKFQRFSQLVELAIEQLNWTSIGEILSQFPLLKKFVLSRFTPNESNSNSESEPDDCSSLNKSKYRLSISTLCLSLNAIRHVKYWECLELPCLTTLELGVPYEEKYEYWPWPEDDPDEEEQAYLKDYDHTIVKFSEILSRADAILETVKMDRITGTGVLAFLALHPLISDLTLTLVGGHLKIRETLSKLEISSDNNPLVVPSLRSLSILFDQPPVIVVDDNITPWKKLDSSMPMLFMCDGLYHLVLSRTNSRLCKYHGVAELEEVSMESELLWHKGGQTVYERFSSWIAFAQKKREDFRLEDPLASRPWLEPFDSGSESESDGSESSE
ncbi:hypothetical protein BDP27DRAFT_1446795 [Rhodocollybia butyracea]|uniref:F-box domain-containing protein n=1 Tax=Rhodocollybia butyracea TaxID=206335 RepID=A0A9P5U965_9AGAR|nr:hypothetical protein BDP27DRAFT_1446795 [Rhodocollybia butyracea]